MHVNDASIERKRLSVRLGALIKALTMEPESAQQGLDYIAALYAIEGKLRHGAYDAAAKLAYRQQYSEPIVNDFFSWVYDQRQCVDLLPSNPLSKGLHTISERQTELIVQAAVNSARQGDVWTPV